MGICTPVQPSIVNSATAQGFGIIGVARVARAGERVCGGHFEKIDDGDELSVETTGRKEVLVTDVTETT